MEGEERTDLEFELGEEKEKHKDKGKKDELDTTSSVVEVCEDEMGKVIEGENCDKNGGGTHRNCGEGANKKKKRKRTTEGGDIVMNNVIDEKELIEVRDQSNGKAKEEADFAGNLKKTNRVLEDDEMSVAAGYEDAAKVNNEAAGYEDAVKVNNKAGDMKRKKEKEQRENVGGELVQNIKTNGMEPGVETQSLDGNIVQKAGFALNESKKEKRNVGKNQGRELLYTVAEKLGTESSEVQENVFIENGGNVQSTADESCDRDLEGGELVQNIKTNGMEPEVEAQSLDGNIMQKDGFALNESKKEKRNGGKNSGCKLLDTVAEKLGTEISEGQENIFLENGGNVQSTADESCNIDLEGGELVRNIKTNGMEPEVETQSLDGNIVQKDGFALNESKIEKRNGGPNSGCKLLDTVAEKQGTESSEVQENIFLENGGNVQRPTADEICNRDLEAVVVDDGKKRKKKKTKSEKHVNVEDSNRDLEVVNVEDGEKNKKAKLEEQVNVEDSNRDLEAVNVEDGEKRKKKAKSEEHVDVEDSDRDMKAVDVEDGKLRKKKAKSEKHVNVEELNRDMDVVNVEDGKKRKKKKKAKSEEHVNIEYSNRDLEAANVEDGKKRKKKKAKLEEHANVEDSDRDMEGVDVEDGEKRKKKKKKKKAKSEEHANVEDCDRDMEAVDVEDGKLRKKKAKSEKHVNVEDSNREMEVVNVEDGSKTKKAKAEKHVNVEDCNANTEAVIIEDSEKKQNASDEVVFSPSDCPRDEHEGLVRGKRFSEEEDKIVREAVLQYIEEQDLGVDGLNMVLHCRSHPKVKDHPEVRNCWKVIGQSIPWRPFKSVYYRAHILFERAEERTWTPEEYEAVRKFHKDHGPDWRTLGDKLGKHRIHVKDAWRRLKLPNHRKGPWSQEEYQTLFDLVNTDLRMKASEEKKTKHGMLRDNICWEAISEKLGTRSNSICSMKWYNQLASPLVNQKLWADIDDYRLLNALNTLQAGRIEDVDWDDLLEHRPGEVCQKRWDQMTNHIGHHALKSFPDQVEVLFKRYPADIIEAIEVYDSKPVID